MTCWAVSVDRPAVVSREVVFREVDSLAVDSQEAVSPVVLPLAGLVNLDAEATVNVSFAEAFRGSERTLSVNNERVQVRIPAGVKNGSACG